MKKTVAVIMLVIFVFLSPKVARAQAVEKVADIFVDGAFVCSIYNEKAQADNHIIYEQIRERGINLSLEKKREIIKSKIDKKENEKETLCNIFANLKKDVDKIIRLSYLAPIDSKITFYPDREIMFDLSEDRQGKRVDESEVYKKLALAIISGEEKVLLKSIAVNPLTKLSDNKKLLYERARFSTDAHLSTQDRQDNITLALSKINGYEIKNEQTFSFNQTVGARSEQNGFKKAKIIVGGKYVDGIGGGVCQASTTVYNACLLAGLSVKSVRGHSLKPSYVSPSFDAMVNGGSSDLVVKNETGGSVFIKALMQNGKATVIIYGLKNEYEIRRKSVITYEGSLPDYEVEEEKAESDEQIGVEQITSYPQAESRSEGYLVYYKNGKKIKETLIRKDYYCKKQGIITKKVA